MWVAALLAARSASAQERDDSVRFAWARDEGAESCPDEADVRRAVTDRVGRDPFLDGAPNSIDAIIRRTPTGYTARFFVRGPNGESLGTRELTSAAPTCGPITEALALALAIVVDPTVALRPDPPRTTLTTSGVAASQSTSAPVALSRRRARAAPMRARPMALSLGASFAGALGVLPSVALGTSIDGELRFSRWISADVSARWLAEQRATTMLSEYALSMASASGAVCVDPLGFLSDTRASFALCAALTIGAISASALRQRAIDGGVRPWVALGPALRGRLRLIGPLALEARVGATFAFARNAYLEEVVDLARITTVFEQPVVGGYGALSVSVVTDAL